MEEKTKNLEDSHQKITELNKENDIIIEQKNDLLNRLTEKMNLNDDLNEKIRRLEHRLSHFEVSKDKDLNLNSYNGGIFLDLLPNEGIPQEEEGEVTQEKENLDNYTINMKVNLKKNNNKLGKGNYGMNRNNDKGKKTLMEISELMHQKPISKVRYLLKGMILIKSQI